MRRWNLRQPSACETLATLGEFGQLESNQHGRRLLKWNVVDGAQLLFFEAKGYWTPILF